MQVWNIARHFYLSYFRRVVKSTLERTVSGVRCKNRIRSAFYWQFLIYIFSVSLNIRACYISSQCGRVHSKECYFYIYIHFLGIFLLSFIRKFVFSLFSFLFFFFWWSLEFPQQNINQSETRIGDKKLPVELFVS